VKVSLSKGEVLHASERPPDNVYFLDEGVAGLSVRSEKGKALQLSFVGSESVVGERAIFKKGVFVTGCAMLTDGSGHRMPPEIFHQEFERGAVLRDLVLCRLKARITETAQTALCNQVHSLEQRLNRWLLTFADRLQSEELLTTHEFISDMLGVGRADISRTAGRFRGKLIDYSRGNLTIVNRVGLQEKTCECYRIIKRAIKEFTDPRHVTHSAVSHQLLVHATKTKSAGGSRG